VLVAALAALALGFAAPPAATATPCWRQVIDDWVDNDRIDGTYALHCYREAIAHVPEDLRVYSGIVEDITSARQQMTRNVRRPASNPPRNSAKQTTSEPNRALYSKALNKLGSRNVDTIPLPLLILAGLSLLLIAAGGAGLVSRRLRERKVPG